MITPIMRKYACLLAILLVSCEVSTESDHDNIKALHSDSARHEACIAALNKEAVENRKAVDQLKAAIVEQDADLASMHDYLIEKNKGKFAPAPVEPMPQ